MVGWIFITVAILYAPIIYRIHKKLDSIELRLEQIEKKLREGI